MFVYNVPTGNYHCSTACDFGYQAPPFLFSLTSISGGGSLGMGLAHPQAYISGELLNWIMHIQREGLPTKIITQSFVCEIHLQRSRGPEGGLFTKAKSCSSALYVGGLSY